MKKIEAIVRPYTVELIKNELNSIGIGGMTVTNVEGFGNQGGHTEVYRDKEMCVSFVPKSKIEIVLDDGRVEDVIKIITENARSGEIGDGKIFVIPVEEVIKIRTGERGEKAI
ncbi:MAG: P-II family nitrogen regulator [Candidatus Gastranaerophilales bacterium]|nr:P-II family nitrogen regulator [Candidatus Gastranaerophilales bacterium]